MTTRTLERTLGLRDIVLIVIGTVIGSGIFIVPASVLRDIGADPTLSMVIWLLAGVLSLLGALTYGELSAMRPEVGGIYIYLRDAFGPLLAFMYGWTLFLVLCSGSIATLASAFTGYLAQLVPLTPVTSRIAALLMVVAVTVINVRGTRSSASVNAGATSLKVGALVVMSVALVASGGPANGSAAAESLPRSGWVLLSGAGTAMIGVLWAYEGWQYATFSAGETLRPQRTFPLGIALGTAALILLYCFANYAYIAALGPDQAALSPGIAATAVGATFGDTAGRLVAAAILVSIFSASNALLLTAPRVFYAMARDGLFFRSLAQIHPGFGTPAIAIVATSLWAAVLTVSGTFDDLLAFVVTTGWVFYALGAASIFIYRRRQPDAPRPFRVPGYPLTPLLFVIAAIAIVVNALFTRTFTTLMGIGFVLLGAPAYRLWKQFASGGDPA
jgi:basic amino acid/polyamine antiporter, APA family